MHNKPKCKFWLKKANPQLQINFFRKKLHMKLWLQFIDPEIESSYRKSLKRYQNVFLQIGLIHGVILSVLNWSLNPLNTADNYTGPPLFFTLINVLGSFLALGIANCVKNFRYNQLAIFALQIYTCVGFIESTRKNFPVWKETSFSLYSITLELILLFPLISRCNWIFSTISSFFLSVYINMRFTGFDANFDMRGFPLTFHLINWIFISLSSFLNEKFDRESFYTQRIYEKSLLRFEMLINDVIPSSIIICNSREIVFYNSETTKLLNIWSKEDLVKRLTEIKIEDRAEDSYISRVFSKENDRFNLNNECGSNKLLDHLKCFMESKRSDRFHLLSGLLTEKPFAREEEKNSRTFQIKIGKIDWEGDEASILILSEDHVIKQVNELAAQSVYKDKLLATVSHDLRTPLNGVIGMLELTLEEVHEAFLRKSLSICLRSSKLLLFMINDILDFSQITNGKLRLTPTVFFVNEAIKDVCKLLKFQAKKKGLRFEIVNKFPADENIEFRSDPNRLKQILLNLLGNALKFTQQGFIKITYEPYDSCENEDKMRSIKFSVEDSGCGIKKKDVPKLFQLFGKLENLEHRKLNQNGIGLGLAISQNLIKMLNLNKKGGEIKVFSKYKKGSTFHFILNYMTDEVQSTENIDENVSEKELREEFPKVNKLPAMNLHTMHLKLDKLNEPRILLVDDDQINIMVLSHYLNKLGKSAYDIASNGKHALDLIKSKADGSMFYNLVFMDCNMPIMDGYEATEKILKMIKDKEIPELQVIATTGNATQSDIDKCYASGMIDYISKPFSMETLKRILETYI